MYVIYPADEVVQLTYGRVLIPRSLSRSPSLHRIIPGIENYTIANDFEPEVTILNGSESTSSASGRVNDLKVKEKTGLKRDRSIFKSRRDKSKSPLPHQNLAPDPRLQITNLQQVAVQGSGQLVKKKSIFGKGRRIGDATPVGVMATSGGDAALRELLHPTYNEPMKSHNAVTFKLVRTVSDFTQQLSQIYEQHAEELQMLVSNFRKRNGELRKERPACPSSLFHTWETLLQEVEIDSQAHSDIASILGRQVSRPLLEKSFHRKIQSRKVFTHRESYETIITKTEEKLVKCRQDYKNAYVSYLSQPTTQSLCAYFDSHNAYVQQLHATNGMLDEYGKETLPQLLQELEEIYTDLCQTLSESVLQGAEVVSARAMEQYKRYEGLSSQCKSVSGATDLAHFARSLPSPPNNRYMMKRLFCPPQPPLPNPDDPDADKNDFNTDNIPPPLKDELVIDRLSSIQVKPSHDALRKEAVDLEIQIKQIQDALDTLVRIQQRSLESNLFNKVNELQEDISMKRFDLRVAQIHLSAINSQKDLFSSKLDSSASDSARERKMSGASTGSMKSKWLKAFKSLKTPPSSGSSSPREADKKNQMYHAVSTIIAMRKNGAAGNRESSMRPGESEVHNFQEYTYKKITPCDICSQVLRGHTRQGLRCRICKMNVHVDCQDKVGKCQSKSRLLRRQKSTSEIETKVPETTFEEEKSPEVDLIYQVLKQAGEISNSKSRGEIMRSEICVRNDIARNEISRSEMSRNELMRNGVARNEGIIRNDTTQRSDIRTEITRPDDRPPVGILVNDRNSGNLNSNPDSSGSSGQSLNRPKPQSQRNSSSNLTVNPVPNSTVSAPHSPRRQKLNLRMKSLSLDSPESTEQIQRRRHVGHAGTSEPHSNHSSSSRIQSPSSPVHNRRLLSARNMRMSSVELPDDNEKSLSSASTSPCPSPVGGKKPHRLLPTNLYVVLYNFKARHQDELDLKAGYKVTVIDTSDPDWWKGKCLGRVGYFPSKYCSKLAAGEKPLQVTHNLQVSDGDNGLMLLRDQIVIQIGEELDGMVMIRSGDNRQGVCPLKFLQEV